MASKRKFSKVTNESDYESNDSDVIPLIKRKIISIKNFEESAMNNTQPSDLSDPSKYIQITEDEYLEQKGSFDFVEKSGPRFLLPRDTEPIEYFKLFFTPSLWTLIVNETNRYAEELLMSSHVTVLSKMRNWYPVTTLEMKAFVAVLLEMTITRRVTIFSYWTENSRVIPWFRQMFTRNRFQLIVRCFHMINDKERFLTGDEKSDAYAKFNPIIEHANEIFQLRYTPHRELFVAESFIHLPSKNEQKCGIKFWMLCDATSNYCVQFYYNRGVNSNVNNEIKQKGLGYNVVVNLLEKSNCLHKGYHMYVDNFFVNTELMKFLYLKNTYLTGMINKNKKEFSNELKQTKDGEVKCFRNNNVALCSYREEKSPKKAVLLISTQTTSKNIKDIKNKCYKGREKMKQSIFDVQDQFMGGMDECDKTLYSYLDERRNLKYWKKVTFHIFARMVLNSYIVYRESTGKKALSRLQYTTSIISEIEREWTEEKERRSVIDEKKTYGLIKLPGRNLRRCVVCSSKTNGIRRSNLICARCEKGLHPLCLDKHTCMQ